MESEVVMLKSEDIKKILNTAVMGQTIVCYDEIDSTNIALRKFALE